MADAPVVISNTTRRHDPSSGPAADGLFSGLTFFLCRQVPTRSHLIADIEANGGRVVRSENQADYIIADHVRKEAPTGSYSYTFITTAIANGTLPDPAEHYAGPRPGSVREVSSIVPAKGTRTPFTHDDDKTLWQWVEEEKARGERVKGNEIYKRLERLNPRHTFQAWRDRYIKKLINHPPAGVEVTVSAKPPTSPPTAPDADDVIDEFPNPPSKRRKLDEQLEEGPQEDDVHRHENKQLAEEKSPEQQEVEDIHALVKGGSEILKFPEEIMQAAFHIWAKSRPNRSVQQWLELWHERARPLYMAQRLAEDSRDESEGNRSSAERKGTKRRRHSDSRGKHDEHSPETQPARPQSRSSEQSRTAETGNSEDIAEPVEPSASAFEPPSVEFLTSDENRAAGQQIIEEGTTARETMLPDPEAVANVERSSSVDTNAVDAGLRPLGPDQAHLPGHKVNDSEFERQLPAGIALTEVNLAAQDAQHSAPPPRGTDLDEDDPNKDQSEYVRYLQQNLKSGGMLEVLSAMKGESKTGTHAAESHESGDDHEAGADNAMDPGLRTPASPHVLRSEDVTIIEPGNVIDISSDADEMSPRSPKAHNGQIDFGHGFSIGQVDERECDFEPSDESNHEVNLVSEFPEHEVGFDLSSSHNSQTHTLDDLDQAGGLLDNTLVAELPRQDKAVAFVEVYEISSTSIQSPSVLPDQSDDGDRRGRTGRALETQDIYGVEAQPPDLSMPLPPDSADEKDRESDEDGRGREPMSEDGQLFVSQGSRIDTLPEGQDSLEQAEQQFDAWWSTMEVRGHSASAIMQALKCTCSIPDLAELVLMHIRGGKGIPDDVPGVWSELEDQQLESGNARAIRLLEAKHGWDACMARFKFLEEYREAD